jgi:hypothetical protein
MKVLGRGKAILTSNCIRLERKFKIQKYHVRFCICSQGNMAWVGQNRNRKPVNGVSVFSRWL